MADEYERDPRTHHYTLDIHHHVHLPHDLTNAITKVAAALAGDPRPATRARLTIETEEHAMTAITVDTANEVAKVAFVDDHNDPTNPPDGIVVTIVGDNDAVCTVGPVGSDAVDPTAVSAQLAPVAMGTVNLTATVTNADGSPFGAPLDPIALTVDPGAAFGARFSVEQETPPGV